MKTSCVRQPPCVLERHRARPRAPARPATSHCVSPTTPPTRRWQTNTGADEHRRQMLGGPRARSTAPSSYAFPGSRDRLSVELPCANRRQLQPCPTGFPKPPGTRQTRHMRTSRRLRSMAAFTLLMAWAGPRRHAAELPSPRRQAGRQRQAPRCEINGKPGFLLPDSDTCVKVGGSIAAHGSYGGPIIVRDAPAFSLERGGAPGAIGRA